jgi:ribosomal protein L40E
MPPGFLFILMIAAIVVLVVLSGSERARAHPGMPRVCRSCGAAHPNFARFCRRCGQKL